MKINKYAIFIAILAITIFVSYVIRDYITLYYTRLFMETRWPLYRYLIPVVTALIIGFLIDIVFDIYMVLINKRILGNIVRWARSLIPNYLLLVSAYYLVYITYYNVVDTLLREYKTMYISSFRFPTLFATLALFISLTYIGVASIKYLMMNRSEYERLNILMKFLKTMKLFWDNKGTFIIWIFIGFIITGLIGIVSETLLTSLAFIQRSWVQIAFIIGVVINTAVLYPYYTYFVKNYILDLIMSIRLSLIHI